MLNKIIKLSPSIFRHIRTKTEIKEKYSFCFSKCEACRLARLDNLFEEKKIQYWLHNQVAIDDVKSGKNKRKKIFCARLYRILRHVMVFVVIVKKMIMRR